MLRSPVKKSACRFGAPTCALSRHDSRQRIAHERLRLLLNSAQMFAAAETLRVQLVDIFRAGRTRCEPPMRSDDLQAADSRSVAGRRREHRLNRVARKVGCFDILRRKLQESCLLFLCGWRIDALIDRSAEFPREGLIEIG